MQFYTYIYRDPSRDNEPIYVGKGKNKRAWRHLKRTGKHPFIQRLQLMKRFGITPDIEIIDALNENHAHFMEVCCIAVIGRKDLCKGPLLNLTDGGEGTANPSSKSRELMGAANRGRKRTIEQNRVNSEARKGIPSGRKGIPNPMKKSEPHKNNGKIRSQEFKDNLSEIHKGQIAWNKGIPATEEHKLKNSLANTGRKDSDEVRAKKSAATKGKVKSDVHRAAISQTLLNKPKYKCLHCGRLLTESNYNKYHNDNCKYKENK